MSDRIACASRQGIASPSINGGLTQRAFTDVLSCGRRHVSELVVVGYRDSYRAAEVLTDLRRREWDWVVDLDQAMAVRWDEQGKLSVQLSVDPTTQESALWARLWGSLLSLALFVPVTEGMTAAAGSLAVGTGTRMPAKALNG